MSVQKKKGKSLKKHKNCAENKCTNRALQGIKNLKRINAAPAEKDTWRIGDVRYKFQARPSRQVRFCLTRPET